MRYWFLDRTFGQFCPREKPYIYLFFGFKSRKCLIFRQSSNKAVFAISGRTERFKDRTPGRTGQTKTTVAIHIGSL
ncbi:MAG: hypothetical protein Q8865_05320 [Bacillota bacterium]|nr:hypothetical protein [Bacillota bacterium]